MHFPWSSLHQTLSGILPYEARTFLTCSLSFLQPRPSVELNIQVINTCKCEIYHFTLFLSRRIPLESDDSYGFLRASHSRYPTQYSHIAMLSHCFYAHIVACPKVIKPLMCKRMWFMTFLHWNPIT